MLDDRMLRQLLRDRLKSGATSEAIRAELTGLGLTPEKIGELASEVAAGERGDHPFETLFHWAPLVLLIPGGVALAVLYGMMTTSAFAVCCFTAGLLMNAVAFSAMRIIAKALAKRDGIFKQNMWSVIAENPGAYWKFFVPIIAGSLLMFGGGWLDPHAIQTLKKDPTLFRQGPYRGRRSRFFSRHHEIDQRSTSRAMQVARFAREDLGPFVPGHQRRL